MKVIFDFFSHSSFSVTANIKEDRQEAMFPKQSDGSCALEHRSCCKIDWNQLFAFVAVP
jgi:hypothetical protein